MYAWMKGESSAPRGGRAAWVRAAPVGLLSFSLVSVGLLALQAYGADRARVRSALAALDGYAEVVAYQLAGEVYQRLNRDLAAVFTELDRAAPDVRGVDALAGHQGERARCSALGDGERWAFRFPVPRMGEELGATLAATEWTEVRPADADGRWAVRAARAHVDELQGQWASFALAVGGTERAPLLVALGMRWRPGSEGSSVYGFRTCLDAGGGSVFRAGLSTRAQLPPGLTGGTPDDSLFSVQGTLPGGRVAWQTPHQYAGNHRAVTALWQPFQDLGVRVVLNPRAHELLAPGSTSRGRLAVTLGLFALNGALLLAALLQLRRERQLLRLKESFVAAVSHELRTPLQQMLLYGDLLRMGGLDSDRERTRAIDVLGRETRRLIHLVENVLAFRPQGEALAAVPAGEPLALDPFVCSVVDEFRPLADSRRVTLEAEATSNALVQWHPDSLRRVVLNLVDNAVKYGPARGSVRLEAARREDGGVMLSIDDEGSGIPERERERVFEPYVRGSAEEGGATGGSGIGLAIVRALVAEAGAEVWVERARGGGARFCVRIPPTRVITEGRT